MTTLPPFLRTLCLALLVSTCFISLNTYGCNGCGGTGAAKINGIGGTGIRGIELTEEQKKAIKAEKSRQEAAKHLMEQQRKDGSKRKAAELQKRNDEIIKRRKTINADHTLKKNALQVDCQRRSKNFRSQFQKRMLDIDIALRQRLNSLASTMSVQQKLQAQSRLKANSLQQKRILNNDNKQRQLFIQKECTNKLKLLDRKYKLRIREFNRALQK